MGLIFNLKASITTRKARAMTEIIDLFGRNKELETLSETLVTITDMEDTDTDVVPEIVKIINQLLDIVKMQQQSIENLACIAEKTIQLERGVNGTK